MTSKKIILIVLIILLTLIGIILCYNKFKNTNPQTETPPENNSIILFYGEECPHCADLEEWILNNKIGEKVEFTKLEVYHNEKNRNLLIEKAGSCGITDSVGVPFLWTGTDCRVGVDLIKQFFQNKISE